MIIKLDDINLKKGGGFHVDAEGMHIATRRQRTLLSSLQGYGKRLVSSGLLERSVFGKFKFQVEALCVKHSVQKLWKDAM